MRMKDRDPRLGDLSPQIQDFINMLANNALEGVQYSRSDIGRVIDELPEIKKEVKDIDLVSILEELGIIPGETQ